MMGGDVARVAAEYGIGGIEEYGDNCGRVTGNDDKAMWEDDRWLCSFPGCEESETAVEGLGS